jgi:uncharacterized lipoprotein YbaY
MKKSSLYCLAICALPMVIAACVQAQPSSSALRSKQTEVTLETKVTGWVLFPKMNKGLPKGSTLRVVLGDVSLQDVRQVDLSQQIILLNDAQDAAFSLPYDAQTIKTNQRYAVSARVEHMGKLLYINDTHTAVIHNGKLTEVILKVVAVQ